MPISYYSDEIRGRRPREHEKLTRDVWGGIVALYTQGVHQAWFGNAFPMECEDRGAVCGCDEATLGLALKASIPELELPLEKRSPPSTLAALDLLQFMYEHASEVHKRNYHGFFAHHHLTFDVGKGKAEMRDRINQLLARSGMAYELDEEGRIEHLASPALEETLAKELPPSGDEKLDELLQSAIEKFRSRDVRQRRAALEPLWDAFERAKTMLDDDKKRGADALIKAAAEGADPREVDLLREEMERLTAIGNEFRIRHHESTNAEVSDELAEQLFGRMYALMYRLHAVLEQDV